MQRLLEHELPRHHRVWRLVGEADPDRARRELDRLLRAVRLGGPVTGGSVRDDYDELVSTWGITPRLAELLER